MVSAAVAALATPLVSTRAPAQVVDPIATLIGLLGGDRKETGANDSRPLDTVRVVATILELERRAGGLAPSKLSMMPAADPSAALPATESDLYAASVPRLVSVIDRAEATDVVLSDDAGELLAEINATQRSFPEALTDKVAASRSRDFVSLKTEYATLFGSASVRPERQDLARWHMAAIQQFRPRYEAVSRTTGVPWFFIGVIHGLEASYNFRAHLHNGDFPLTRRTRQVPAGRPRVWLPPSDWESSAVDALRLLGFAGATDWSLERTLYRLEAYNGFGYRKRGMQTPYLWSFSSHYEAGKFVSDGTFDPRARSQQCGAAITMKLLTESGAILWA